MSKKAAYGEFVFDICYLFTAFLLSVFIFYNAGTIQQKLVGIMGIILVCGDSFHLIPRVLSILSGNKAKYAKALGIGKLIASITMTIFYIILWQIAVILFSPPFSASITLVVYILASIRILLCLLPQNRWTSDNSPVSWSIIRNIPFVIQGVIIAIVFWMYRNTLPKLSSMWLAIALSFLFYIPVVLWADKNPKIGMFMLPKTIMYIWILIICLKV